MIDNDAHQKLIPAKIGMFCTTIMDFIFLKKDINLLFKSENYAMFIVTTNSVCEIQWDGTQKQLSILSIHISNIVRAQFFFFFFFFTFCTLQTTQISTLETEKTSSEEKLKTELATTGTQLKEKEANYQELSRQHQEVNMWR